jgi:hypothetical protein
MQATCKLTGKVFEISEMEQGYCRVNDVPLPTLCPKERLRYLCAFRNRVQLYHSKCEFSDKNILTCIPPDRGFKVYDVEIWQSDKFNALDYGVDYDFSRSFFDQMWELYRRTPLPSMGVVRSTMINSDYCNGITGAKNCYLVFSSGMSEDCLFCYNMWSNKGLVDCALCYHSELCYECVNIQKCYRLKLSKNCENCSESSFLMNCFSCRNCFGCVNLSNKQYCFYNEQLTKEEYEKRISEIDLGSYDTLTREQQKFNEFRNNFPSKAYWGRNNENSSGHLIHNNKNCDNVFIVSGSEDVEHGLFLTNTQNSMFHTMFGNKAELIYSSCTVGDNAYNVRFSSECYENVHDLEYCLFTGFGAGNCFGCVGVQRKEYCVFNKQYSKDDYFALADSIKTQMRNNGEYGKFFPPQFSPFYFNNCDAAHFFPLAKAEAIQRGFQWEEEGRVAESDQTVWSDSIDEVGDDILERQLVCEKSGKPFKLVKQELDFYRRERLPIPRVSPMERIRGRTRIFEWRESREEQCARCGEGVKTMCPRDQTNLLCERCWQREMY